MSSPGSWLRTAAARLCTQQTMDRLVPISIPIALPLGIVYGIYDTHVGGRGSGSE